MVRTVLTLLCFLFVSIAFGADKSSAQREREVKVALALAGAEVKPAVHAVVAKPVAVSWFAEQACTCCETDKPCPCKAGECGGTNCPAGCLAKKAAAPVAAPTFHWEYQTRCIVDAAGRQTCRQVLVAVQDK